MLASCPIETTPGTVAELNSLIVTATELVSRAGSSDNDQGVCETQNMLINVASNPAFGKSLEITYGGEIVLRIEWPENGDVCWVLIYHYGAWCSELLDRQSPDIA